MPEYDPMQGEEFSGSYRNGKLVSDENPLANPSLIEEIRLAARPNVEFDVVKRPAHYNSGTIEVWDYIIDQGLTYCMGNAVKYISRAGKKDPSKHVEDIDKAIAFLQREKKRVQETA